MEHSLTFGHRYGIALAGTAFALLATWALQPLPTPLPGGFLFISVLISAAYGGLGPGLFATVCSLLALDVVILSPVQVLNVPMTQGLRLSLFAGVASAANILVFFRRRFTAQLQRANAELEARVAERTAALTSTHAALAASEARYRELFENATDIVYTHDLQGRFTSINKAAERLSGYSFAEALRLHVSQVVTPAYLEMTNQMTQRQLAGETLPPYELEIRTKVGRRVPLEVHSRLIMHDGQPSGIQGIARDISERKQVEEALRRASEASAVANRAKSEFLATMSHELRTPLSVILGYIDILLDEEEAIIPEHREALRRIEYNARELLGLITAVLDVSRLEAGRLPVEISTVDVPTLLKELEQDTQDLQDQARLTFIWEATTTLPPLQTDQGKLKIILKNLFANAVKFTEHGSIAVRAENQNDGVAFTVQDTGFGIPPEALTAIFEPFHQANGHAAERVGGVGLGLAIVQRMVTLLGGKVSVESTVGSGSTFRVWVPIQSPADFKEQEEPATLPKKGEP